MPYSAGSTAVTRMTTAAVTARQLATASVFADGTCGTPLWAISILKTYLVAALGSAAESTWVRPAKTHPYKSGIRNNVRMVDETSPPMTTVARGRCTSAPVEVDRAIGTNPRLATSAVIKT